MKRIAAPMVGGVITSTILELIIYPAIYMIWLKDAAGKDVRSAVMTVDYNRHTMLWMFAKKYIHGLSRMKTITMQSWRFPRRDRGMSR